MIEFTNVAPLVEHLRRQTQAKYIGVDGFTGVGKSWVCERLAEEMNARIVDADCFQVPQRPVRPFVEQIDSARLHAELLDAAKTSKTVIFTSICLLEVARRVGWDVDFHLYVKRIDRNGFWNDGIHLEAFEGGEQQGCMTYLYQHHKDFLPHECCDALYLNQHEDC
jgi:hypothetical protein